jgi:hypothetical protein
VTDAKQYIEALEIEREGYVLRGLHDRVKQVDEQIKVWEKRAAADKRKAAESDAPADAAATPDQTDTAERKPRSRR